MDRRRPGPRRGPPSIPSRSPVDPPSIPGAVEGIEISVGQSVRLFAPAADGRRGAAATGRAEKMSVMGWLAGLRRVEAQSDGSPFDAFWQ